MNTNVIWKYPLELSYNEVKIHMPQGARVLDIQVQNSELTMWVSCDPTAPRHFREFVIRGTGHKVNPLLLYHATVQANNGFVWHIFENQGAA